MLILSLLALIFFPGIIETFYFSFTKKFSLGKMFYVLLSSPLQIVISFILALILSVVFGVKSQMVFYIIVIFAAVVFSVFKTYSFNKCFKMPNKRMYFFIPLDFIQIFILIYIVSIFFPDLFMSYCVGPFDGVRYCTGLFNF